MPSLYDVIIVGGGIHGCATAAVAAYSGLSVLLIEKDDLASHTSSASSKLIHGGLRYLEQGELRLVHQAIQARERLFQVAPHLVRPLGFVLPFSSSSRPKWQIRCGLACYDFFARSHSLASSRLISRHKEPLLFKQLAAPIERAALYYDAQAEDSRLTIEMALQAKQLGASILTRTALIQAQTHDHHWRLTLKPQHQPEQIVEARAIINTAGPWVNEVQSLVGQTTYPSIRWIKGSHVLLPSLYPGNHAYLLQHPSDGRVIFCIPYHGHTLVGTTDVQLFDLNTAPTISAEEITYLFELIHLYFKTSVRYEDIRFHWSGIRTCLDEANTSSEHLSRRTTCHFSAHPAPMVSLYGGKLTTHAFTAQELLKTLKFVFPTASFDLPPMPLPGAQVPDTFTYNQFREELKQRYRWLPPHLWNRYVSLYGTRITALLKECSQLNDLGALYSADLYEREIQFLQDEEWAQSIDDILWRRTKLGLAYAQNPAKCVISPR